MIVLLGICINACSSDEPDPIDDVTDPIGESINWSVLAQDQTPYELPESVTMPPIPTPAISLTQQGVELGRMLFYDPILSKDSTVSCASCHGQTFGFTDHGNQFSQGVEGQQGARNAMSLINLAWNDRFFWDGRSPSLEDQALQPVPDPVEMHLPWEEAITRLMRHRDYRIAFYEAFGSQTIDRQLVVNAIAQFELTLISNNSLYDKGITPGSGVFLDDLEGDVFLGMQLFFGLPGYEERGECYHCHGTNSTNLFTNNSFDNNGLDFAETLNDFSDLGLGKVTGQADDNGKFKIPSLRNIELTAPYMHDGRFQTLEEVVEHYNSGVKYAPNLGAILATRIDDDKQYTGLGLTEEEKAALVAFLKALTDTAFVNNPAFSNPFN